MSITVHKLFGVSHTSSVQTNSSSCFYASVTTFWALTPHAPIFERLISRVLWIFHYTLLWFFLKYKIFQNYQSISNVILHYFSNRPLHPWWRNKISSTAISPYFQSNASASINMSVWGGSSLNSTSPYCHSSPWLPKRSQTFFISPFAYFLFKILF